MMSHEALTRAFTFADKSAAQEIHAVGVLLARMLTLAMHPGAGETTDDDIASPATHVERAVRLILR